MHKTRVLPVFLDIWALLERFLADVIALASFPKSTPTPVSNAIKSYMPSAATAAGLRRASFSGQNAARGPLTWF
ncbi:hypothetical protein BOTBODRAFT_39310 [Botryobasidium botryosum FD-172 SS1]|uniref:Uncharacterized protein n=1 Tax=Botryobasidium botryosum (strain FD-172 SS1) TaxID=930990 RepID=A0A067M4S5_BOTB1|nr:hypothetical protein BOTBODRAFT_39310 [Botryobasidium botryosum FD-172 SS1]